MIGRSKEVDELERLYQKNTSELVVIYGRRRVGKTFLVNQLFNDRFAFKHTALSPEEDEKVDLTMQLDRFHQSLIKYGLDANSKKPKTWFDAFDYLELLLSKKEKINRLVVFIDEFPWLDTKKSDFLKAFEGFWNNYGCANNKLMIIVCGSANSWMQKNLINNVGGLYGRVTYEINLMPFSLKECEEFFASNNVVLSRYDIATSYMIFGGIPYYLGYFANDLSLPQNVDNIIFKKSAPLKFEFDRLFSSCFENPNFTKRVVLTLNKKRIGYKREEIIRELNIGNGGNLTAILNALISSNFVEKYKPFGVLNNVYYYRLIDPFCLFYLNFVHNNSSSENFYEENADTHQFATWRGLAFENLCFNHIPQIKFALGIPGISVNTSAYYSKSDNCQIDLMITRKDNIINLCEIKFYSDEFTVDKDYFLKVNRRTNQIMEKVSKKYAVRNVLISTYGLKKNEYSSVFTTSITLDDLFKF